MQPDWTHGVTIDGFGWIIVLLIAVWLLLAEPLLGRRAYQQFLAALARNEPDARVRFYRLWVGQGWGLMVVIMVLAVTVLGWTPTQLGLRWPHVALPEIPGFLIGAMVGALAGGVGAAIALSRRKHKAATAPTATPKPAAIDKMLPRTHAERGWFAGLALTAGITEEVIWRGLLLAILVALWPSLPVPILVLVMAVMFGWAHLYQGPLGILTTGILGAMLAALYLATGSLLLPMLVHALIDLAALLRGPAAEAAVG